MTENVQPAAEGVQVEPRSQDLYKRVESKPSADPIQDGEIRLTGQGRMKNYIEYATNLLEEKKMDSIIIKAMGKAINKAVACAEIVKRRTQGDLHQHTTIGSIEVKDVYEPLQEGLSKQEFTRYISIISIKLSRQTGDTNAPGYQAPIPQSEHRLDYNRRNINDGSGRGAPRGARGFPRGRGRGQSGFRGASVAPQGSAAQTSSQATPQAHAVNPPIAVVAQPALEPLPPRRGQFRGGRGGNTSGGRGSPSTPADSAPTFEARGGRGNGSASGSPRGGARRGNGNSNRGSSFRGGVRGGPAVNPSGSEGTTQ